MPVRERSLVEKVGIVVGGVPLELLVALNGWAVNVAAAIMTTNPVVSRDVSGRVFLACIAYCLTSRQLCGHAWQV
jgi:hypothetical protein